MAIGELLGFGLIADGHKHRDRLPVPRDEQRLLARGLQVVVDLSRELRG